MNIAGLQKLTLQDFPNQMACIIFTQGCNLACPYCHNSDLIHFKKDSTISEEEFFSYLHKRNKLLDGVVISGGEPLLQKDIIPFIKKIRELNLKVKLDTNGTSPDILKKLIDEHLIDYVAMDIKNDFNHYDIASGCKNIAVDKIKESIDILKKSDISYEFRTTIVKNYHNFNNIKNIAHYLGSEVTYYLQNFEDNEYVLNKDLIPFTNEELLNLEQQLKQEFPNIKVRGI